MKKLKSTLPNMILSLGLITIIAGLSLAWVYEKTKAPIARSEQEKQIAAVKDVLPEFNNDPVADAVTLTTDGKGEYRVFPATLDGKPVGAAVESRSMDGFSGEIRVMFGFDSEGKVTGYTVLQHAETPGLGAKMGEWFRNPAGRRSVIGINPATANVTVSKDGGDIDGITAATITSRAFLGSLRDAYKVYQQYNESK